MCEGVGRVVVEVQSATSVAISIDLKRSHLTNGVPELVLVAFAAVKTSYVKLVELGVFVITCVPINSEIGILLMVPPDKPDSDMCIVSPVSKWWSAVVFQVTDRDELIVEKLSH